MECIILTPLGETVLDLSVEDISDLRARAIMKATSPDPSPVTTTPSRTVTEAPPMTDHAAKQMRRPSRVETMFGPKDTWDGGPGDDHALPHGDGGPAPYYLHQYEEDVRPTAAVRKYTGFLSIQCENCGKSKDFCAKVPISYFKCGHCGHETHLERLTPAYPRCDHDGRTASYMTNKKGQRITIACVECQSPMRLRLNDRGTAYIPVKEGKEA